MRRLWPLALLAAGVVLAWTAQVEVSTPVYGGSVARLIAPATRLQEVRTDSGGRIVAPRIVIESDRVVLLDGARQSELPIVVSGDPRQRRAWLGTDALGRDVAARIVAGGLQSLRTAMTVCLMTGLIAAAAGLLLAMLPARARGFVDLLLDTWIAIPQILILMVLSLGLLGAGVELGVAIAVAALPGLIRLCQREALAARAQPFILAAVAEGCSPMRVALRHLGPLVWPLVVAALPLLAVEAILLESSLTFLGFAQSARPHAWGGMIAEGMRFQPGAWWLVAAPAVALVGSALGIRALGAR